MQSPDEFADPLDSASAEPAEALPPVTCWRCGKVVANDSPRCPFCAAKLTQAVEALAPSHNLTRRHSELSRVMVAFGLLLLANVVQAIAIRATGWSSREATSVQQHRALALLFSSEAFDTLVVLATWFALVRSPKLPRQTAWRDFTAWLAAAPILVGLLAVNMGYHRLLLDYLRVSPDSLEPAFGGVWWPWLVLAICVQPAIVEELFFRRIAFDSLAAATNAGAALVLSSVMFAMAHTGVVLSIPLLFLMGLGFGVARLWSGGLLLPMVMHAGHNAYILLFTGTYR